MYTGLLPNEPILMPFQSRNFNGDSFIAEEFIKLKEKFDVQVVAEMGSCVMGTAKWLGENFPKVYTVEIHAPFRDIGLQRIQGLTNIESILGSSVNCLGDILKKCDNRTIVWLDSHWAEHFPLFDELKIIKASGLKPIIVVHDCKVEGEPNLGFDSYGGVDISFANMKSYIDDIYGVDGYEYHCNTDLTSTIVKRGIIYIYPKE